MKYKKAFIVLLACCVSALLSGQAFDNPQDPVLKPKAAMASGDTLEFGAENVPNIFTPNGDNTNDFFEVDTPGETVYDLIIFTRTGTKVFDARSPRIFWDGRNASGNEVPEGIYYYVIRLSGKAAAEGITGFVYLYR
ncbi:MAG: gliding motility-associated C-terminal domain-containing protein [Bacteroidales bacterium]|nr:gliding motility-associated C-terminal domain-containing protein [Bacteroidales bacterium]MBN2699437.1 gliding motility-associated C-terminal domain-containing protein [Bacteroidales bacterium]